MDMLRYDQFTGGRLWATEYGSASEPGAVRIPDQILAAAQRQAGHVLSGDARHHRRSRRPRRAEPLVQVRGGAAGGAGLRSPVLIRVRLRGSHGYRPTDKLIAASRSVGVRRGASRRGCRLVFQKFRHVRASAWSSAVLSDRAHDDHRLPVSANRVDDLRGERRRAYSPRTPPCWPMSCATMRPANEIQGDRRVSETVPIPINPSLALARRMPSARSGGAPSSIEQVDVRVDDALALVLVDGRATSHRAARCRRGRCRRSAASCGRSRRRAAPGAAPPLVVGDLGCGISTVSWPLSGISSGSLNSAFAPRPVQLTITFSVSATTSRGVSNFESRPCRPRAGSRSSARRGKSTARCASRCARSRTSSGTDARPAAARRAAVVMLRHQRVPADRCRHRRRCSLSVGE